jgi:glycosyltransferase involved in cell wall biosynthesis
LTQYFSPAYKAGGPIRSIKNLIDNLGEKYIFDVVTSAYDLDGTEIIKKKGNWLDEKWGKVVYSNNSILNLLSIYRGCSSYNTVYINSFFSFRYSILPVFLNVLFGFFSNSRIIIAPRGELTFGAMSLKTRKKKFYLYIFRFLNWNKLIEFQFTSEQEKLESLEFLSDVRCFNVPNMHEEIPSFYIKEKQQGSVRLLFLARIARKKNLHLVFEALANIKDINVELTVVGPIDESDYWDFCRSISKKFTSNISWSYFGVANREQVRNFFKKSHCYILPTKNENYGHSIVEAMVGSNIVILSDQTPWNDVEFNGGFICRMECHSNYVAPIVSVANMTEDEYNIQAKKTYDYVCRELSENLKNIEGMFE